MSRTRIEFSSLELDVMEDALSSYTYDMADEMATAYGSTDPYAIIEAQNNQQALNRALEKIDRARDRIGKREGQNENF